MGVNSEGASGAFLHVEQVAERYGVVARTVREWARNGRIPCYRNPGTRRLLFPLDLLDEWDNCGQKTTKYIAPQEQKAIHGLVDLLITEAPPAARSQKAAKAPPRAGLCRFELPSAPIVRETRERRRRFFRAVKGET